MSLNWLEINRVLEELPLEGSFLQNIRQCSFTRLVFEFHRPGRSFNVLICLNRQTLRIHEISRRPPSLSKPPRFTSYMRSRIKGARIIEARQLGSDRIILLVLRKGEQEDRLYIRLWGGAANLILCDRENRILDAFSRRPARGEVPGELFREPEESGGPRKELSPRPLPEGMESYSLFLEELYGRQESEEASDHLRQQVRKALEYSENALMVRRRNLTGRLQDYNNESVQRQSADCLMANIHQIEKGARSFRSGDPGYDELGEISLDPRMTAVENAQAYYKKAGKAARGRELTEEELNNLDRRLETLRRNLAELDGMDAERLKELLPRENPAPAGRAPASLPGLSFSSGGLTILVGRSAKENEALLGKHVRGNDLWLHTRDYPGAYVFVRTPRGKTVPLETLLDAGNLALFYSKAKGAGAADLYYTQVKYLRKPKNGKRGLVLPSREKNLYIKQDLKRIRRLKGEEE
jgi:predicted ribosome quality control (RQC) complex YloA/Tae2 family protein